jgi:hypothetical protein
MSKVLLTVCALGVLLSPAFAEDKPPERLREEGNYIFGHEGLQKHQFTRVVPSGTKQRISSLLKVATIGNGLEFIDAESVLGLTSDVCELRSI